MDSCSIKTAGPGAPASALAPAGPETGTAPTAAPAVGATGATAPAVGAPAPRSTPAQQSLQQRSHLGQPHQQQSYPTPRTRIYYNPELSKFSLGEDHPMVPHRLHLTHRLAELWGLFDDPAVQVVRDYPPATTDQLRRFHTDEYIAFLEYLNTLDLESLSVEQQQELLGEDLALFGLSVCRPAAPPSAEDEEATAVPLPRDAAVAPQPRGGAATAGPGSRQLPLPQQPLRPKPEPLTQGGNAGRQQPQPPQQQQLAKVEPKVESKAVVAAAGAGGAWPAPAPAPAPTADDLYVPPQLIALATQLLTKLAPAGGNALTPAQHQQLITYLRQHQLQMQQKHAAAAPAGAAGTAAARAGLVGGAAAAGARPSLTMVRPGQVTAAGKAGQPNGGGGGGSGSKKRKAEGGSGGGKGGKGGGGGNNKKRSKKKRRSSYSDDDEEEEEEISDEDDDPPVSAAPAAADTAVPGAAGGTHSRPSRQAATAVAALTNAVRATEAEESDDDDSDDEEDEEDDDEGGDCPIFPGLLRYVGLQAAGSILAARDLASGLCDVAVHWGGGMHHGMPYRAFGFCYVNDLVLAILELMAGCGRVLYIDIDVHHGDGVETAFKRSEKVLSISLHKWDDGRMQATNDTLNHGKPQRPVFFPGTGKKNDLGEGSGKYFTVNVPLQDDITDDSYYNVYKAVVKTAFERFKPQAVVLQCGCDSVAGDKLGRFNLSIRGHSRCVELVRDLCRSGGVEGAPPPPPNPARAGSQWRVPLLVTGGGGYTPPLVARCWALETAVLLGRQLGEAMPPAVALAEDLADLGPSYFREPGLSRPPSGNYQMCLDTIMLPHLHKQMDSDYSLSRLAAYLTSNMQRITIRDGTTATATAAGGGATGGGDGAAAAAADTPAAGGKDGAKDGGAATAASGAANAAAPAGSKSKSRKSAAATGPGVPDPLKHLTAPTGYPDAEEYIQDQKDRVTGGAAWAAKMPPPPTAKGGRKLSASAAAAGGNRAGSAPGSGSGKGAAAGSATAAGGKAGAVGAAAGLAAGKPAAGSGPGTEPVTTGGAAGAALVQMAAATYLHVQVPGVPVIRPYKPKTTTAPAVPTTATPAAAGGQ